MQPHTVVNREDWYTARRELLVKEKEFTRLRDELSAQRRQLPWEKVHSDYVFDAASGKESLSDLFEGRSQLVMYHFMYGPDWEEGCPSCSYWADNFEGISIHLNHRDITLLVVSRAPLEILDAYRKRMGWSFKWVSSFGSDFNYDYQASFRPEDMEKGEVFYNFRPTNFPSDEAPGVSVFYKNGEGGIFHTYSCYARGLDMLNGAYQFMDIAPKGRDESGLPSTMDWLRRHDMYED